MKKLLVLVSLFLGSSAIAGYMSKIPVQLIAVDNQGRIEFINTALSETGLLEDKTARYRDLHSIVISGDQEGSDFKGAHMVYEVTLDSRKNGYQEFQCHQFLSVGNFDQKHTRPIECKKLN